MAAGPRRSLASIGGPPTRLARLPETPAGPSSRMPATPGSLGPPSRKFVPPADDDEEGEDEEVDQAPSTPVKREVNPALLAEVSHFHSIGIGWKSGFLGLARFGCWAGILLAVLIISAPRSIAGLTGYAVSESRHPSTYRSHLRPDPQLIGRQREEGRLWVPPERCRPFLQVSRPQFEKLLYETPGLLRIPP